MTVRILEGDCRAVLPTLPDESVHCVVTSPPYWNLRLYLPDGHPFKHLEMGSEPSPDEYVESLVSVFREVRRVLRRDGTVWLNLGDSYVHKNIVGIPWRVALALQADGWWLRSDIIWHKPNPMPDGVTDRPTKAHEYLFLLTKAAEYYYDADAVREPHAPKSLTHRGGGRMAGRLDSQDSSGLVASGNWAKSCSARRIDPRGRNLRTVWTIPTEPYPEAHFATFPPELAQRCILAGCPGGGMVLDPFGGSGTVGEVATVLGRHAVLIELDPASVRLAEQRCAQQGLFAAGGGE